MQKIEKSIANAIGNFEIEGQDVPKTDEKRILEILERYRAIDKRAVGSLLYDLNLYVESEKNNDQRKNR